MTDKKDKELREALSGYFVPFLLSIIFSMITIIGYFGKNAYDDLVQHQNNIMTELQTVKQQLNEAKVIYTVNSSRITRLEEWQNKEEAIDNTLLAAITDVKIKLSIP